MPYLLVYMYCEPQLAASVVPRRPVTPAAVAAGREQEGDKASTSDEIKRRDESYKSRLVGPITLLEAAGVLGFCIPALGS